MLMQQELWSSPIARRADADSSHVVADEIDRNGTRLSRAQQVLAVLKKHPNATALELERYGRLPKYICHRRLADLANCGIIERGRQRICYASGRICITWRVLDDRGTP